MIDLGLNIVKNVFRKNKVIIFTVKILQKNMNKQLTKLSVIISLVAFTSCQQESYRLGK